MFLQQITRKNPELIKVAAQLHQAGAIPPNTYVNDVVVITKGSDGAVAYHKKEKYSDKYVTKAIDSVGAGDAFNAGFLSAYVHKLPIEVCLSYGCACGSAAVQKVGGGIPMSWEILTASVKDHMTKRGSTSNF